MNSRVVTSMKPFINLLCAASLFWSVAARAQTTQATSKTQGRTEQGRAETFDLAEYGVVIEPDARLIAMMVALEAAGFDPEPGAPSAFRAAVRRDLANLDAELRARLRGFYERHKLPAPATPAEQAARYVSLALALGGPPDFEAPAKTDDLPAEVVELLDFAPLLRQFYRRSGLEENLPNYLRTYRVAAERLRAPTAEMVRLVLSYLHTRPVTEVIERVPETDQSMQNKGKKAGPAFTTRVRRRTFRVIPDLLAAPETINFRIIGDDYYAIIPYNINPLLSELRRAYLQYVLDPLIVRFGRDIAARREAIKQIIDSRPNAKESKAPDLFFAVARSLVIAADARIDEMIKLFALQQEMSARYKRASTPAEQQKIREEADKLRAAIADETTAQLAEAYERGAVLDFYFAEKLRDLEGSGFDIANFFSDMIASFDATREMRRPAEYRAARERVASRRVETARASQGAEDARRASLIKDLAEVDELLRLRNYVAAEARLKEMLKEHPNEPRIYFALAQAASLAAEDTTDDEALAERLNRALANYRASIEYASPERDGALLSRAHTAMGRILAFFERDDEALREFDAAIKVGQVVGGAYQEALTAKANLLAKKKGTTPQR
jgi:hypothetical protein